MHEQSEVCQFYEGRDILLTGATGFLGKVLLEKLIRSCPSVNTVYLLLRPYKEQSSQERLEELFQGKVFDRLRQEQPYARNKLVPLSGDISQPLLGLEKSDQDLLANCVTLVFNCAANVKFHATLKSSVEMNVLGTQNVIELCRQLPLLQALVHVSTAYSNCDLSEVDEVVYPPPVLPQHMIDAVKWMDEDLQKIVLDKIIGKRPNVYTLTKALAEALLAEAGDEIPVSIVRPSIITGSFRDPYPGWADNAGGPASSLISIGKGIVRTLPINRKKICDLCPVDFISNLMLTVAWSMSKQSQRKIFVYNCMSGALNPITLGQFEGTVRAHMVQNPSEEVFRYPREPFTTSRAFGRIQVAFHHYLPALLVDLVLWCSGRNPRMVKLYRKVDKVSRGVEFFMNNEWTFHCRNVSELHHQLSSVDKKMFLFDFRQLSWEKYLEDYALGLRRYVLNEDPSTIPAARTKLKRLYYKTQVAKAVVYLGLLILLAGIIYACVS